MDTAETEQLIAVLLRELNERRGREGKPALSSYPEVGCTYCGEIPATGVPLFPSASPRVRTCQNCVLKQFPFTKLRLSSGEIITWHRNNPTFHRTSDYGIVLTDRALYLYSP